MSSQRDESEQGQTVEGEVYVADLQDLAVRDKEGGVYNQSQQAAGTGLYSMPRRTGGQFKLEVPPLAGLLSLASPLSVAHSHTVARTDATWQHSIIRIASKHF